MKWILVFAGALASTGCGQFSNPAGDDSRSENSPAIDQAPYANVTEADALTVTDLESAGYSQVDYYPVGCIIPDQPDAACDATGAVFMDQREFDDADIAIDREEYDRYEFVCPAIDGKSIADWKCRNQENNDG